MRNVLFSTTVFIYSEDDYLMLHRTGEVGVDKNRLNGIGGKLEEGENFLDGAIRETKEETGFVIAPKDVKFSGIVKLQGGYPDDWVMCFFKIKVLDKKIPHGNNVKEGELIWMNKNSVLESSYELVDDLHHLWSYITKDQVFFATTKVGGDEKVKEISVSILQA